MGIIAEKKCYHCQKEAGLSANIHMDYRQPVYWDNGAGISHFIEKDLGRVTVYLCGNCYDDYKNEHLLTYKSSIMQLISLCLILVSVLFIEPLLIQKICFAAAIAIHAAASILIHKQNWRDAVFKNRHQGMLKNNMAGMQSTDTYIRAALTCIAGVLIAAVSFFLQVVLKISCAVELFFIMTTLDIPTVRNAIVYYMETYDNVFLKK